MSSQKGYEEKPLYYYHLNKYTGEVTGRELDYKITDMITNNGIFLKFKFRIGKNQMVIYEWEIGKVSDQGIYIVTFNDDPEAAADLLKKHWEKKLNRQQDKIEKELLRYDEMKALYEKIC